MVTFTKNWELALFSEKGRSIRNTNLLPLELNKSLKTVQFNNQLLARKTKHFLPLMTLQALGGTTSIPMDFSLDSFLYESQNNKPIYF
jgi:hypothetical protein